MFNILRRLSLLLKCQHTIIFRAIHQMAFCLMWWPAGSICRRRLLSLSITKWAARTSQERFNLESPQSTWISIPTYSTATPDMTTLTTSGRKLSWKLSKIWPLVVLGGICREQFKQGSPIFTHLSGTIGLTNLLDTTSLAASSQLQNAIKYCSRVRKTGVVSKELNNSATV